MTDTSHPDPIQLLRSVLWGAVDADTAAVERHVTDDGCRACARQLAGFHRTRDDLRHAASATPSGEMMVRARAVVSEWCVTGEQAEVDWLQAEPVLAAAGVRAGPDDDLQVVCSLDDVTLHAMLHVEGSAGTYAVTGQLVCDGEPLISVPVSLVVDEELGGDDSEDSTDEFGEFRFSAHRGRAFGLRIGDGPDALHVALWKHAA